VKCLARLGRPRQMCSLRHGFSPFPMGAVTDLFLTTRPDRSLHVSKEDRKDTSTTVLHTNCIYSSFLGTVAVVEGSAQLTSAWVLPVWNVASRSVVRRIGPTPGLRRQRFPLEE
jgi:hypothetical protein